jgi:predicted  nucleic acid-binding Zn-ribbon protein
VFKSGGVIDVYKKINGDFDVKLTERVRSEMKAKHAFTLLIANPTNSKSVATASRQEKSEAKAKALDDAAEATRSLADTTATRNSDAKYLADRQATWTQEGGASESRQDRRAEEIEANTKAQEILENTKAQGAARRRGGLNSEIDELEESIAQLSKEIIGLNQAVADSDKDVRAARRRSHEQGQAGGERAPPSRPSPLLPCRVPR